MARRSGEDWYLAVMTLNARSENIDLSFLGDREYTASVFRDNENRTGIVTEQTSVTKEDGLLAALLANGGMTVKFTKNGMSLATAYNAYDFYEAADDANELTGSAAIVTNQFVSDMERVSGIGWLGKSSDAIWKIVTVVLVLAALAAARVLIRREKGKIRRALP